MTKSKLPSLPGTNKKERDIMKTFMGCDVGEERASYLKSSEFFTTAQNLVAKGWLQIGKLDNGYQYFSLTSAGKQKLAPREQHYAII